MDAVELLNKKEARQQYAKRQSDKYERMAKNSLDENNQKEYEKRAKTWKDVAKQEDSDIIKTDWSQEAIERRAKDEKIIRGYRKEHAVLYDSSGRRIFHKKGREHNVEFSNEEIKQMAGGVLTHNHPLGATFSEEDIYMLKSARLSQIRAVGRDGVYTLKCPAEWPVELDTLKKIKEEYNRIDMSLREMMEKEFVEKNMTVEDYNIVYQNKIIEQLSQEFGLDYGMEVW